MACSLATSHYDHLGVQNGKLYAGANDNGSGVAAMLEVARLLAHRSLARGVLFGSEEQLMLGSYHYVARPLRPLDATVAVLNLDRSDGTKSTRRKALARTS